MPQPPRVGELRTSPSTGEKRVWTGAGWQLVPSGAPSGSVGFQLPPTEPSGRTDAQDMATFRKVLKFGGATVAPLLLAPEVGIPARIAAAALGGAAGSGVGHAMDFNPDNSAGTDLAEGAMDGALLEGAPAVLGKGLGWVGAGLSKLGKTFNVGSPWMRGMAAREMGLPGGAVAAAVAGPPVAQAVGRGAEAAGDAIGTQTLSQRLSRLIRGDAAPPAAVPEPKWWQPGQSTEVPYRMPNSSVTDLGNVPAGPGLNPAPPPAGLPSASPRGLPPADPIRLPSASSSTLQMPPSSIAALERATGTGRSMEPLLPYSEDAAAHNITRNAPYGMGQVLPVAKPTEFSDAALEGLQAPDTGVFDANLGMTLPRVPDFEFEAGDANVPGLSIDQSPSLASLARATKSGESVDDVIGRFADLMRKHGATVEAPIAGDVQSALQSLGYTGSAARNMAQRAVSDGATDVSDAVRRALRYAK